MKYENARDLLPEQLLKQVQKYVSGKLVYIPARARKRQWGTLSGYRQYLEERNHRICLQYMNGASIGALADEYHLSLDTVRRIIYGKAEGIPMTYCGTLSSACEWAEQGRIEAWVHAYLLADGHNRAFSDGLRMVDRVFIGPVRMPLESFCRCTGPAGGGTEVSD